MGEIAGKTAGYCLLLSALRSTVKLKEMGASQMILRSTIKMVCLLFSVLALCDGVSGQEFDESFELWPVDLKINGTVLAGGGSELPEAAAEYLLAVSGRAETIVRVQLPNVKQGLNSKTEAKFDEIEIIKL